MFRIRRMPDDTTPANAAAMRQVLEILREQFAPVSDEKVALILERFHNPIKHRLHALLFVAERAADRVRGFAWLLHAPDLKLCFLDYIAAAPGRVSGGIGGALYERVREEALALGADGLFFECLPDDPALSPDPVKRKQNADRLRFYELYGARPVANTAYETPVREADTDPPYLVFDGLGRHEPLRRDRARTIVRAILERKYGAVCPPAYIKKVVDSFRDDPVALRPARYKRGEPRAKVKATATLVERIPLVVNDKHDIHHVRDRGYVQAPVRIRSIVQELDRTQLFERIEPRRFPDTHIRAVHSGRLFDYLKRACALVEPGQSIYPYLFPIRNAARPPRELPLRAGYFCIDTFTPLNNNAYLAARRAVDCAMTAAEKVLEGHRIAYALVRPPGHHAERRAFGGFCYFNNAAIAASYLSRYGRVAVLDIDYHHGNGTQDIFYQRSDVLTVSLHGHPSFAYPYFSGYREEEGLGPGAGYNANYPLPERITAEQYRETLGRALRRIGRFKPEYLVVAVGFDTAAGDPTGSWQHRAQDFAKIGQAIGTAGYPTLMVQEGGYRTRTLGVNARNFFLGLWEGARQAVQKDAGKRVAAPRDQAAAEIAWREQPRESDIEAVRSLVAATGVFRTEEVSIARELVEERLARGIASGYHFVFTERAGRLLGYACYGPIPGTRHSFDLYWIAIEPAQYGSGLARQILHSVEDGVRRLDGTRLYVDTSTGDLYQRARAFYRRNMFQKAAELPDFYREGEGKVIFAKELQEAPQPRPAKRRKETVRGG